MFFRQDKKILVTHNGKFHADDIFACATLQIFLDQKGERYQVIRIRDEATINSADYVFDVGGIYDHEKRRYDHHQKGGAGKRDNEIPYAAFGLVWKHYGALVSGSEEVAVILDKKIAQAIDADDNGMKLVTSTHPDASPYTLQNALYAFRPTWKEGFIDEEYDKQFDGCVVLAKELLKREIQVLQDNAEVESFIAEAYEKSEDKRVIELQDSYPWEGWMDKYPQVLFVIYPRMNQWRVGAVSVSRTSFENKKDLPASWAGQRDEDLQKITGVNDAVFCHNGRFLAVAKSKEGAWELAQLALKDK